MLVNSEDLELSLILSSQIWDCSVHQGLVLEILEHSNHKVPFLSVELRINEFLLKN